MIIGTPNGHSPTFKKFIKDIADSKTKYEESLVMQVEVDNLKKEIKTPYATSSVQHERLVKLIYIHMLGYDATFGVIDAIKFAQQSSLFYKRVGYLVSSLLLNPGREESLLLCCSLQKDLASESVVEQSMALTAICQLMGKDTISAFLPTIIKKLSHPKEIIRKKAVDVLYQFLREMPEQTHDERYLKALCDPDAGVMISALPIYLKLCKEQPDKYRHMNKAFTDILIQIVEGRLHNSFNYHTFPAPWAQVYLLQILHYLGCNDKQLSENMSHVLHLVIARASGKMTTPQAADAAVAVLYQVCQTILSIYPNQDLILLVTRKIDEFLNSASNKIHLGLQLLEKLCEKQPSIGATFIPQVYQYTSHQCTMIRDAAIKVLRVGVSPDTLTDATRVLLDILSDSNCSKELEAECCSTLAEIGRKHAPSPAWYVGLLLKILAIASPLPSTSPSPILNTLINYCTTTIDAEVKTLIQKAAQENDDINSQKSWLSIWALGRYDPDFDRAGIWVNKIKSLSDNQIKWLLDSLVVLVTRLGALPAPLYSTLHPFTNSPSPIIRQLAIELVNLSDLPNVTDLFNTQTDMLSVLIEKLANTPDAGLENTTAHKQFLTKFRKRANGPTEKVEFGHDVQEEGPKQRVNVPSKDGTPNPAATWVSYHEHIPEEASANDKPEPPLSQPALRSTYKWGEHSKQTRATHSDPTRC
ncbi:AP-4 complex subunit epsilon-1-like isoform X1 [Bolinopsis microptera]|uniref:AP-4 complex subunit epsilon-1-like isoform X1 n=2 Tax=Bolinopsis microptera TaxID=2820187 RepID=UPI003079A070